MKSGDLTQVEQGQTAGTNHGACLLHDMVSLSWRRYFFPDTANPSMKISGNASPIQSPNNIEPVSGHVTAGPSDSRQYLCGLVLPTSYS